MNYLQKYQAAHGLDPDGKIGNKTAAVMIQDLDIDSTSHFAYFIAQVQHESANFTAGRENMNYSAAALKKMFGKYFKGLGVAKYARNPEKIANRIYACRMGNGDDGSGDGWKYRGGGGLQLTGKDNYAAYFDSVGLPEDSDPDIISEPEHYFKSAKFFFDENDLWRICGAQSNECTSRLSKAINLGNQYSAGIPHGLDVRIALTNQYFKSLVWMS
jgi:putative chitinase